MKVGMPGMWDLVWQLLFSHLSVFVNLYIGNDGSLTFLLVYFPSVFVCYLLGEFIVLLCFVLH